MSLELDGILGALLVGTWANSMLNQLQAAYYYRHFKHDNWKLKLLVTSAIAIDFVSMIANYASVYLYTITHWGPLPLYVFATGVAAALAQSFLAVRYWRLTKNIFITLTLFLFIMVAAGGAFVTAVTITILPEYHDRGHIIIPGTAWFIAEAVTDISIALALLWEFRKIKTSFKETRSLFNRLAARTIQTGVVGATMALAILFLGLPLSIPGSYISVSTGIAYCLGRVYCLTMLANLNSRQTGNTSSNMGISSGANSGTRGEHRKQAQSESGDDKGGIRGFLVHMDPPQNVYSMGSFKTNDDSPADDIEMTVNDSASYLSKKKQNLFAA
ncbi:hypothetical protein DFH09DRAFT_1197506 [Mycena vulgaris]|nr:hypothetical protein DFH09DRAFT_1197506 [Mycena vulgaris]